MPALKKKHRQKKNDSLKMSKRDERKEKMSPKGMFFDDIEGFASKVNSPFGFRKVPTSLSFFL